jgi:molybdopterin synthase catalytic subunit
VVVFWGAVRSIEHEREISGIRYEAHAEMAEHQMRTLARQAADKFGTREVLIRHRIGFIPVAEPSIVVRVMSGHRGAAFEAAQWIMDELKRVVPIWKHPVYSDEPVPAEAQSQHTGAAA